MHATIKDRRLTNPKHFVNVIPYSAKGDLTQTAEQLQATKAKQIPTQLHCYCASPIPKEMAKNAIQCVEKTCYNLFHLSCAGNPTDLKDWTCATCKVKTKGASWSQINSCPIDNMLTLHTELVVRHPGYLSYFDNPKPGDAAWCASILYATNSQYDVAQQHWAAFLNVKNLYGSPEDMLSSKLEDTVNFVRIGSCDNDHCDSKYTEIKQRQLTFLSSIEDPKASVLERTSQPDVASCGFCKQDDILVTYGPLLPQDQAKPPPLLEISNALRNFNFDEVREMPDEVVIGKYTYNLKNGYNEKKAPPPGSKAGTGGHFFAFMNFDGQWLHYDGLDSEISRFKPAYPAMWTNDNVSVYNVVYTLNEQHFQKATY
jgi:hypothetical protein